MHRNKKILERVLRVADPEFIEQLLDGIIIKQRNCTGVYHNGMIVCADGTVVDLNIHSIIGVEMAPTSPVLQPQPVSQPVSQPMTRMEVGHEAKGEVMRK